MKEKYNTKQREKILNYLKEHRDIDNTAGEIVKYFSQSSERIGKATVYRFLNDLVQDNKVRKYRLHDQNCSGYQFVDGMDCENHYHLKCEKCNKIIHLECDEFRHIQEHILKEHGFELDERNIILYGVCKDCI